MKWYTISWVDLVSVEIPRPLDDVRWWPWWLRRPSRYASEWQRRSVRIEAENVRDAVVHTVNPSRAELMLEEDTPSSCYVISEATTQAGPAPWFENDDCRWPGEATVAPAPAEAKEQPALVRLWGTVLERIWKAILVLFKGDPQ